MKSRIIYVTVFILFLSIVNVLGQSEQVQRKVFFETSAVKTFKVPCDVEITKLSQLDLVYLEAKPTLLSQTEFVIENNMLSIIRTYLQKPRYERDYEFQMGKSITDALGTRLYTQACVDIHTDEELWQDRGPYGDIAFGVLIDQKTGYLYCNTNWSTLCVDLNKTPNK